MIEVGSIAVRRLIEVRQPLIGLRGQVRESRGIEQFGRSICLSPVSEYNDDPLTGAIVSLADPRVVSHLSVDG